MPIKNKVEASTFFNKIIFKNRFKSIEKSFIIYYNNTR